MAVGADTVVVGTAAGRAAAVNRGADTAAAPAEAPAAVRRYSGVVVSEQAAVQHSAERGAAGDSD